MGTASTDVVVFANVHPRAGGGERGSCKGITVELTSGRLH
jgi:hypothetical protein